MQFKNSQLQFICYAILGFFALIIIINSFNIKNNIINTMYGMQNFNAYNTGDYQLNTREGFTSSKSIKDDSIDECINRKINSTRDELGGDKGCKDVKKILTDVKKSCNLEGAKCMMNLLSSNKSSKTINLEKIINNDNDDDEINKYKQYTELSTSLQNIIDNI
tara:strand:+ start:13530 stop:14018 length:489 start_codon:yes stop_codon:yes gene_type:complete